MTRRSFVAVAALMALAPVPAAAQSSADAWEVPPPHGGRSPRPAGGVGQQHGHTARAARGVGRQDAADRRGGRGVQGGGRGGHRERCRRGLRRPAGGSGVGGGQGCRFVRSGDRQLQPVLAGRARLRQPDVAHHRPAGRAYPGAHPGRHAWPAPVADYGEGRYLGRPPAQRTVYHLWGAVPVCRLQRLLPDLPEPRPRRGADGDDPRRARDSPRWPVTPHGRRAGNSTAIRAAGGRTTRW